MSMFSFGDELGLTCKVELNSNSYNTLVIFAKPLRLAQILGCPCPCIDSDF